MQKLQLKVTVLGPSGTNTKNAPGAPDRTNTY